MRIVFAAFALYSGMAAQGATFQAPSCTLASVQSTYNSAADGDRILIPAGSCTWNATLTISKGVEIVGAGESSTTLVGARFTVNVPSGRAWRVSGFTTSGTAGFNLIGHSKAGRIDHITFASVSGFTENRIIWINPASGGYSTGLIDHVTVANPQSINVHVREDWGNGNQSFMRPLDLGGADAWYVEDSNFSQNTSSYNTSAPVTDCDGGGRIVFRHNTIKNNYFEMHDAIIAGLRSCRKWEIYENVWTTTSAELAATGQYAQIAIRGGNGVVFNNTFAASSNYDIIFSNYRSGGQTGGTPWGSTCQASGASKACLNTISSGPKSCSADSDCGGVSGSCVKIDGSLLSTLTNYPCRDQLGTDGTATQVVRPALFWNNKIGAGLIAPSQQDYSDMRYLSEGRDYCIGSSAMPNVCAGVSSTYAPYSYPHPLQNSTISSLPVAPTNLIAR